MLNYKLESLLKLGRLNAHLLVSISLISVVLCDQCVLLSVDGQWGVFGSWSSCSVTCGDGGLRTRQRVCNNPPPSGGGAVCSGSGSQKQSCSSTTACPGKKNIQIRDSV